MKRLQLYEHFTLQTLQIDMNYQEAVQYLESFINYEKIGFKSQRPFKLERARRLGQVFGNPQESFPSIHITGTKGKGSIASFISTILSIGGFNTGLYTSPHLMEPRERIKINNEMITESEFAFHASEIRDRFEIENLGFSPTFFEIYTILAFNYFKEKKIDYGVIEVGMGGRLDTTNIIYPLVSVISPISYDHTYILGDTLEKIAFEKSGIIKERCVCVSAPQKRNVLKVIRKRCESMGSELILVGKEIGFEELEHDSEKEIFNIRGMFGEYKRCTTCLLGRHQIINAACAVATAEVLRKTGVNISKKSIEKGIEQTKNQGRCEVIAKNPYVILDGAQNRASAKALKETAKRNFNYRRFILVLGISRGKDVKGICEELTSLADIVILTKAGIKRAENPRSIAKFITGKDVILTNSVIEALLKAEALAGPEDMILVTGSFFVIGEARGVRFEKARLIV